MVTPHLILSTSDIMMKAEKSTQPESSSDWKGYLVLTTGGLLCASAAGWYIYREWIAKNAKIVLASFAAGAAFTGVYCGCSSLVSNLRKIEELSTAQKYGLDYSNWSSDNNVCQTFSSILNGLNNNFAWDADKSLSLMSRELNTEAFQEINKEEAEMSSISQKIISRLNDLNRKPLGNVKPRPPVVNQLGIRYGEDEEIRKAKFRQEIIFQLSELKGYVQAVVDPLPAARSFQLQSSDISDEIRQRFVMVVREFADSLQPKLDHVIDEFLVSKDRTGEDLGIDQRHEGERSLEPTELPDKCAKATSQKRTFSQRYEALEKELDYKSKMSSSAVTPECKIPRKNEIWPEDSFRNVGINDEMLSVDNKARQQGIDIIQALRSPSSTAATKASHVSTVQLQTPSKEVKKADGSAGEKSKNAHSFPRLILSDYEKSLLEVLRSELQEIDE